MPRLIFKCPYLKPDQQRSAAHRENYVRYIATRERVEFVSHCGSDGPATEKQKNLAEKLLRDFPHCRELFEYEDYLASPTCRNASEFITRALEDNFDKISRRENYVGYIARRPRAERTGSHGLFTSGDSLPPLSQIAETVARHPGNVWLPIISLRREDAARLGYDNAGQWKALLSSYAPQIAEAMKIPLEQFRWYAAFHDESHHPHIHMVCYSSDGKAGFLTKEGIAQIKSGLAKVIFRQDLTEIYQRQTERRDALTRESQNVLQRLIEQMRDGTLENPKIEQFMLELARRLKTTSGKKQYGYLKAPLKSIVDEIVDELEKDPRLSAAYELWYQMREEVLRTYKDDLPERLPLSRQKEFKRIKNIVIEEAVRLSHETAPLSQADAPDAENTILDAPPPADMPPETYAPDFAEESPPVVVWSSRYKEARLLLRNSSELPPDVEKARRLLLEEAQAGNALAMFDLGRLFSDGVGGDFDSGQAQRWHAKALAAFQAVEWERPNRYVEYRIGKMFAAGLGTKRDYEAGAIWFMKAAEGGYSYAQYSLAKLYSEGQGVERDCENALRLYESAAAKGFPYAAWELGKQYRDGVGTSPDRRQSAWYFSAAFRGFKVLESQNHDGAVQYRIGWMLLHGVGSERDEAAARKWFEKAAQSGNENAQYQLAKLVLDSASSTPEEISQAMDWLIKAAEAGSAYAQYALGKLYRDGKPVEKNDVQAAIWFSQAAEQGNQFAQYALGKLYLLGKDVPQDKDAAVRWFTLAAEQGNVYAQYFLDHMDEIQGPHLLTSATRLLHHMSRIFQEQPIPISPGINFVDSKLRRRIREKKIAMGHKPDDHEDQGIAMR